MYRFHFFYSSIAHVLCPSSFAVKRRSSIFHLPSSIVTLFSLFYLLSLFFSLLSVTPVYGATYYVSATIGKDTNAGLSEVAAWKTIAKVNASIFRPGDQILFKRGEMWREQLNVPSSGTEGSPITFGAYGAGALPVMNGADLITPGTSWTVDSSSIWKAALTTKPLQVYFDGIGGTKKDSKAACTAQYDWYWTFNVLYTYAVSDPETLYTNPGVEAPTRESSILVYSKSYITIQDLESWGTNSAIGRKGIYLVGGCSNVTVRRCKSSYNFGGGIGIMDESGGNTFSNITITNNTVDHNYGTGIHGGGKWSRVGSPNYSIVIISYNTIHHNCQSPDAIYCAGIYAVTDAGDAARTNHNLTVEYNTVYYNGIDGSDTIVSHSTSGNGIWMDTLDTAIVRYNRSYGNANAGIFIENGYQNQVYYNLSYNNILNANDYNAAGIAIGVSRSDLYSQENMVYNNVVYGNKIGLYAYGMPNYTTSATTVGNSVKNNVAFGNTVNSLRAVTGAQNVTDANGHGSGNIYTYNDLGPASSNFIEWGSSQYSTYSAWETATGNCGSTGCSHSVQAAPQFINTSISDFHLLPNSPCIDAGTNVSLTQDYDGKSVPQGRAPDIGAFEYNKNISPPRNLGIAAP